MVNKQKKGPPPPGMSMSTDMLCHVGYMSNAHIG